MSRRTAWWFRRSMSQEYQEAYDKIAEKITLDSDEVLTDFACGTAEVIRRIPMKGKIIGTDLSGNALLRAKKNLRKHKIPCKVFLHPISPQELQRELKEKRVTLIMDNMYESKLPDNLCHKAVHTFPEYVSFVRASDLKKPGYKLEKETKMGVRRDREIHRILKPNGVYHQVVYDILPLGRDYSKLQAEYLENVGLNDLFRIVYAEFIINSEIGKDAGLDRDFVSIGSITASNGYGIVKFEKI